MPGGAPRNDATRIAVLRAGLALTAEVGYERCSIEGIARQAGTSKQTIYRWWPSKAAILQEAFEELVAGDLTHPDTGDARQDFRKQLTALAKVFSDPALARPLSGLIAAAQSDPDVAETMFRSLFEPRRKAAVRRLVVARERGEIDTATNPEMLVDLLYGPLYYRLLVTQARLTPAYVRRLVAVVLGPDRK